MGDTKLENTLPARSKMSKNTVQIAIVGPNKKEIIALKNVQEVENSTFQLIDGPVTTNLSLTIGNSEFVFESKEIPIQLFELLKNGTQNATVGLVPFGGQNRPVERQPKHKPQTPSKNKSLIRKRVYSEAKETSILNTPVGTSGRKKFFEGQLVAWVDIVVIAIKKCGPKTKLDKLYEWAAQNIYCEGHNGEEVLLRESGLPNWEASIRQNRRKALEKIKQESAKEPSVVATNITMDEDPTSAMVNDEMTEFDVDDMLTDSDTHSSLGKNFIEKILDDIRSTASKYEPEATKVRMNASHSSQNYPPGTDFFFQQS